MGEVVHLPGFPRRAQPSERFSNFEQSYLDVVLHTAPEPKKSAHSQAY